MKNNMLNKWKSDYEELELKPSSELWSRLEMELEKESEEAIEKPFQWWKYAAVILICISVGGLFYFNSNINHDFNEKKADYAVSKVLTKTIDPANPEFQNPLGVKNNQGIQGNVTQASRNEKTSADPVSLQEAEKETAITKSLAVKIQNIAVNQDEKVMVKPPKIEVNPPVIADVKKAKPTYINSSELLLGHEFDKSSGNHDKKDVKIGILNFDKPVPDVENVTVLGVTVYVESK